MNVTFTAGDPVQYTATCEMNSTFSFKHGKDVDVYFSPDYHDIEVWYIDSMTITTDCSAGAPTSNPTSNPTSQPSLNPTSSPSNVPSSFPSNSPSRIPSINPSFIPSNQPTKIPIHQPPTENTTSPTSLPSIIPTTPNSTGEQTEQKTTGNDTLSRTFDTVKTRSDLNNVQQIGFIIVVIACIIILLIQLFYTKIRPYQNTDIPKFGYVVKFLFQMTDLLSDISVAELMYLNSDFEYFYCSMIFIILPLIVSILCLFYFKFYEWNLKLNKKISEKYAVSQRIVDYFDKYWILLLLWCVLSCNFYSAITLSQSKIFCLSMFNLQLKRKEYESLAIIKFVNSTICENIAQIIVQILYLQHINVHSLLVYISLTFSLFSILSQVVIFLSQLNNILIKYNKHVTQILSFDI